MLRKKVVGQFLPATTEQLISWDKIKKEAHIAGVLYWEMDYANNAACYVNMWLASDLQVIRPGKAGQNENKTKNVNSGDIKSLKSAYIG